LQWQGINIFVNLALPNATAYGINRDEFGMPTDFLKRLLQISCSYLDKNLD